MAVLAGGMERFTEEGTWRDGDGTIGRWVDNQIIHFQEYFQKGITFAHRLKNNQFYGNYRAFQCFKGFKGNRKRLFSGWRRAWRYFAAR
jgi:hypothetical protein